MAHLVGEAGALFGRPALCPPLRVHLGDLAVALEVPLADFGVVTHRLLQAAGLFVEALAALDPLWVQLFPAEQARIVQLLIERVDIGTDGLKLKFRDKGLAQMVAEVGTITSKSRKAAA